MTRGDVFIQVFSELCEEPQKIITEMLQAIKDEMPPEEQIFDEEISENEASILFDELMQDKEAVLEWFLEGYRRFIVRTRAGRSNA